MTDAQPEMTPSATRASATPAPVALQLWTVRELTREDFEATLRRIAEIGFLGIEVGELHGMAPAAVRDLAGELDLQIVGLHADEGLAPGLDVAEELGTKYVIDGFYDFTSLDELRGLIADLNAVVPEAAARGLAVGYHNHHLELVRRFEGRTGYEIIFDEVDPSVVAEVDMYWVEVGGGDALDVLGALGERVRLVHVKDGAAQTPEEPQPALGKGAMDIPTQLAAAAFAEWHIVEIDDCEGDVLEAVEQSYAYLVDNGLSRGRR